MTGAAFSYDAALDALARARRFGINPSLEGATALVDALGRPQDRFASVQVTGTNGKSSTTRLTAALLRAHGFRVGAYTSPELESMTERIEIDGTPVSEADFARGIQAALDAAARIGAAGLIGPEDSVTEFELLTAAALWLFAQHEVEFAVLEVGMGGRWDATSVVSPAVSVITGVGLDHTDHLGTTREEIASDKAYIIKAASTPVLGPGTVGVEHVFLERAALLGLHPRAVRGAGSPTPVVDELTTRFFLRKPPHSAGATMKFDVVGSHGRYRGLQLAAPAYQAGNAATAISAAEAALGRALTSAAVREAFSAIEFPGRFEVLRGDPPVVIDGAHNPQAAIVLAGAISQAWPNPSQRPVLLIGVLADKDARGIVEALAGVVDSIAVTSSHSPRALPARDLVRIVEEVTGVRPLAYRTVAEALDALVPASPGGLMVTGSITVAGEARAALRDASATR